MQKVKTAYYELEGTHYEIGQQTAKLLPKGAFRMEPPETFTDDIVNQALAMFDEFCPGLTEELRGFADESGTPIRNNAYTWMTYLLPRCSSMALKPERTANGHTMIARNYEFSIEEEDFKVIRVAPQGKYAHIGGSLLMFGRTEGINEAGLAVSMSSCGFPVSNLPGMREPMLRGLHFYAVLRCLLDNCRNVEEAITKLQNMPIAYNLNLILADRESNLALAETMSGELAVKRCTSSEEVSYLCATNHIAIESFQNREPMAMRNSVVRYQRIQSFIEESGQLTEQQLRSFLLSKYPEGMTVWYYKDFFGTVKSVIIDVNEGRFSICWGGREENGWEDYYVDRKSGNREKKIEVIPEPSTKEFFEIIPIR